MSASVADDMIRSYFDRWQRLEEEKRTISDDLKEMFAEARGNGLDTKALRAVFREQVGDKAALQEFDAICDLYRASLNAPRARRARESQSYAEAKGGGMALGISEVQSRDPETGAPTDTQEQPETPASEKHLTAPSQRDDDAARQSGEEDAVDPVVQIQAHREVSPSDAPPSDAVAETQAPQAATATLSDADVPDFVKADRAPINERCEKPLTCRFGRHPQKITCSTCSTAWAIAQRKKVPA